MIIKKGLWIILGIVLYTAKISGQTQNAESASCNIKVEIKEMIPEQYSSKKLSAGYYVQLQHDSVFIHLPYSGRVYSLSYTSDGLNFKTPIHNLDTKKNKNGNLKISFRTVNQSISYRFRIEIASDSSVLLFIKPDNAQHISYEGFLSTH